MCFGQSIALFRKAKQGTVLMKVSTPYILNINYFNSVWISWIDGVIRVGKGTVVGNNTMMAYTDTAPSAVNYVALSGWPSYAGSAFFNGGL